MADGDLLVDSLQSKRHSSRGNRSLAPANARLQFGDEAAGLATTKAANASNAAPAGK